MAIHKFTDWSEKKYSFLEKNAQLQLLFNSKMKTFVVDSSLPKVKVVKNFLEYFIKDGI